GQTSPRSARHRRNRVYTGTATGVLAAAVDSDRGPVGRGEGTGLVARSDRGLELGGLPSSFAVSRRRPRPVLAGESRRRTRHCIPRRIRWLGRSRSAHGSSPWATWRTSEARSAVSWIPRSYAHGSGPKRGLESSAITTWLGTRNVLPRC